MKHKIKAKVIQIAQDPKVKKAFLSMKPEKTLWGIIGVLVFFIFPEVIAYIWGSDITMYAQEHLSLNTSFLGEQYYKFLHMTFEDGVSFVNLFLGIVLLVWLFF